MARGSRAGDKSQGNLRNLKINTAKVLNQNDFTIYPQSTSRTPKLDSFSTASPFSRDAREIVTAH